MTVTKPGGRRMRATALAISVAFLGSAETGLAQELSAQQREFAGVYARCTGQIRRADAETARQSIREGCQAQFKQLIGLKLDNWVARVARVRLERDIVELEVSPFEGEKVAVLSSIQIVRIYTGQGEMSTQPYYQQMASQLKSLNVRRGEMVRVTSILRTGEQLPGMMPHDIVYGADRLEISLHAMIVTRP